MFQYKSFYGLAYKTDDRYLQISCKLFLFSEAKAQH